MTYLGHSACMLEAGGKRLLIDPFLSGNPAATLDPETVECDYVLLTHGHQDHYGDTELILRRTGACIIAPYELANYVMTKTGCCGYPMNHGGGANFDFGRLNLTNAIHSSSLPIYGGSATYLGNPCGFIIQADGKTFHHAGDTALTMDMQLTGEFYEIDVALLPIGDCYTMGPIHAAKACEFLQPKRVVPVHYNTFPAIEVDVDAFADRVGAAGVEVLKLGTGDTIEV